jgi:tetratricopeptide (TPR) repeat protein
MKAQPLLAAATAALLLALSVPAAHANSTTTSRGQRPVVAEGDEDADKDQGKRHKRGDEDAPRFPNATRAEPNAKPGKLNSKLGKIFDLNNDQKYDEVLERADELIADPKANGYERAQAERVAGASAAALANDDYSRAIDYFKRALAENTLSNNDHYDLMLRLADLLMRDEKFDEGLKVIDQYLAETKTDDPQAYLYKGDALYQAERYPEAIEALKKAIPATGEPQRAVIDRLFNSYMESDQAAAGVPLFESLAARRPDDVRAQLDLARMYGEAKMGEKAVAVFQRLQAAGKLTKPEDYAAGVDLLANLDGRENDTIAFIQKGLDSGVLKPDAHTYALMGQSYYYTDRFAEAAAAYEKGAPLAKDGELFANMANAYLQIEQWAKARDAAQQAIAKGLRTPGNAWMIIAAADDGLGDKAGRIAAYREAAKDPKTRDSANKMLKALGAK